jgi:phosphoglycerate dehydrogenase-like enzyme
MKKSRILILNATCLDVVDANKTWLDSLDAEFVCDPAFRTLSPEQVDSVLRDADGLVLPSAIRTLPSRKQMETHTRLKVLSIAASGYDWLDVQAATELGIVVPFAPVTEGAEVVADMTFALMLAVARQVPHHHQLMQAGRYERGIGVALWKKTLGIVGLGNIGRAVARRAKGFDMNVLAVEPYPQQDFVRSNGVTLTNLDDLLRKSDFISLHVRLDETTRGMIGRRELGLMKPSAFLINAARQELVDEQALAEALPAGRLAGAAMDDPPARKDSPMLTLPNFVCTPHLGNRAIEGITAVFKAAVQNAVDVLHGRRPAMLVNPQVYDLPERQQRFPKGTAR